MAKRAAATIEKALPPISMVIPPPIDFYAQADPQTVPSEPTMSSKPEAMIVVTCLEVPMMQNIFDGYYSERVDCRLDSVQKKALRHLQFGLQSRYARLRNGKEVANGQDTIKWILENLQ